MALLILRKALELSQPEEHMRQPASCVLVEDHTSREQALCRLTKAQGKGRSLGELKLRRAQSNANLGVELHGGWAMCWRERYEKLTCPSG